MTNVEGMTKYEWQKPQSALLPVSHLSFVISFTSLPIGNFAIAGLISKSQKLERKYASPHLVYLRRLPRGLRGQGAHAYASIDHVDSRARYCGLDYRRRGHSSVLSAWRRGQIPSWRSNCFNRWGDFGFVHLAQVQAPTATGIGPRSNG